MTSRNLRSSLVICSLMLGTVLLGGCTDDKPEAATPEAATPEVKSEKKTAVPASIEPARAQEVQRKLARADAFDGTEDMVVSKCSGCALAMDGSGDHAVAVEGYSLHFCSDDCASGFGEDLTASILAMNVPAKK